MLDGNKNDRIILAFWKLNFHILDGIGERRRPIRQKTLQPIIRHNNNPHINIPGL